MNHPQWSPRHLRWQVLGQYARSRTAGQCVCRRSMPSYGARRLVHDVHISAAIEHKVI